MFSNERDIKVTTKRLFGGFYLEFLWNKVWSLSWFLVWQLSSFLFVPFKLCVDLNGVLFLDWKKGHDMGVEKCIRDKKKRQWHNTHAAKEKKKSTYNNTSKTEWFLFCIIFFLFVCVWKLFPMCVEVIHILKQKEKTKAPLSFRSGTSDSFYAWILY